VECAVDPRLGLSAAESDAEVVAKFFRALGDPTRLRLLEFLLDDEHTVTDCVAVAGLSQGRSRRIWAAWPTAATSRFAGRDGSPTTGSPIRGSRNWSSSRGRWPPTTPPRWPRATASPPARPKLPPPHDVICSAPSGQRRRGHGWRAGHCRVLRCAGIAGWKPAGGSDRAPAPMARLRDGRCASGHLDGLGTVAPALPLPQKSAGVDPTLSRRARAGTRKGPRPGFLDAVPGFHGRRATPHVSTPKGRCCD